MSTPRRHRTRALTVAAGIVACVLGGAAYTVPEDGEAGTDPSVVASEDAPAEVQDEAAGEEADAAPTAEREFEHEYEPEPTESPAAGETDAAPASAPTAGRAFEHEVEPEPEPAAPPPAPAPAPTPEAPPPAAPPDSPPAAPPAAPPADDAGAPPAPAEHPVAVAGSPAPHPGPPPAADAPDGPDDADVTGAGGSERTSASGRATAPSGSMTALRSSTMDAFDDEVLAPLVAPREVARAGPSARRVTAVTPADRELLASAGPRVAAPAVPAVPAAPAAFAGSSGAPSPTVVLASALLTLVGAASAGAYALRRRRAR